MTPSIWLRIAAFVWLGWSLSELPLQGSLCIGALLLWRCTLKEAAFFFLLLGGLGMLSLTYPVKEQDAPSLLPQQLHCQILYALSRGPPSFCARAQTEKGESFLLTLRPASSMPLEGEGYLLLEEPFDRGRWEPIISLTSWRSQWKQSWERRMKVSMPFSRAYTLYTSMVTGTGGNQELRETLRRFGLTHLLALSGLHVTIVLGVLLRAWMFLGVKGRMLSFLQLASLLFYVMAVGPSPSILRAAGMSSVALVALLMRRSLSPFITFALVVIILLCWDPSLTRHLGFQLSCAATWSLLLATTMLKASFSEKPSFFQKIMKKIGQGILLNGLVVGITAPLLLNAFHEINILSVFVNWAWTPLLTIGFLLSLGVPLLGRPLGVPLGWCTEWLLNALEAPWWFDLSLGPFHLEGWYAGAVLAGLFTLLHSSQDSGKKVDFVLEKEGCNR